MRPTVPDAARAPAAAPLPPPVAPPVDLRADSAPATGRRRPSRRSAPPDRVIPGLGPLRGSAPGARRRSDDRRDGARPMNLLAAAAGLAMDGFLHPVAGARRPPLGVLDGAVLTGVSLDSRRVGPGDLFFAIRGPNHDGHAFVADALARGAAGAVVARDAGLTRRDSPPEPPAPPEPADGGRSRPPFLLEVRDTTVALGALARQVRIWSGATICAITGSVGKTTAKEAAAAALGARHRVFRTRGNRNNQWGLPLTLLENADHGGVGVVELGMSAPGEITALTGIAIPQVGLVTGVAEAHLEHFDSVEDIARAKGELYEALPPGAVAVANADDPRVVRELGRHFGSRGTYGFSENAEVRGSDYRPGPEGGMTFAVRAFGSAPVTVRCGLEGRHNASNVLAGLAIAVVLGVPLAAAAEGVRSLRPLPGRGDRRPLRNGAVAIDETYNSSPVALRAVIRELAATPPTSDDSSGPGGAARRILVAGDMLELGARGPELHEECGRLAAEAGLDLVVGVGPLGKVLAEAAAAAGAAGAPRTAAAEDPEAAASLLADDLRPGDRIVFKASRAVGLERALARLAEETDQECPDDSRSGPAAGLRSSPSSAR